MGFGISAGLINAIDSAVDGIKAVTDNLPDSGALNALAAALSEVRDNVYGLAALEDLIDNLETRLTAARAGYLDNLSAGAVALASEVVDIIAKVKTVDYGDALHYDSGGAGGTAWPIGTATNPCSSLANIRTMAAALSIKKIIVHSALTLDADMKGYEFIGFNPAEDTLYVDINGKDIDNSTFRSLFIKGAIGGAGYYPFFKDCIFGTVTSFKGFVVDCAFYNITLAAGIDVDFWNCSIQWGAGVLTVGAPSGAFFYGFKGALDIKSMTGGTLIIFGSEECHLHIFSTCTGGAITIYGGARVNDESGAGCAVTVYGLGKGSVPVNINAISASETNVFQLQESATRYLIRSLRLKCADPEANTVTVKLYERINGSNNVLVDSFVIDSSNWGTYHSLMDMFGLPHLDGDFLRVTVQSSAGTYAVTGQYSLQRY